MEYHGTESGKRQSHGNQPERSRVDWILEAVALLAVVASLALAVYFYPQIPERVPRLPFGRPGAGFAGPGGGGPFSARTALWSVTLINTFAYLGLTLAARGRGIFDIPEALDREAPHVRQMLFSMVIVMKAVLALFGAYLVWSLINVGLRRGPGMSGAFLTAFTLAVPVPLIFYTLKLRRYKKEPQPRAQRL